MKKDKHKRLYCMIQFIRSVQIRIIYETNSKSMVARGWRKGGMENKC